MIVPTPLRVCFGSFLLAKVDGCSWELVVERAQICYHDERRSQNPPPAPQKDLLQRLQSLWYSGKGSSKMAEMPYKQ